MDYIVKEGDWLLKIAIDHGFRTEKPLLAANPALRGLALGNMDVLTPGWSIIIPDRQEKSELGFVGAPNKYRRAGQKKNLRLTFTTGDPRRKVMLPGREVSINGRVWHTEDHGPNLVTATDIPIAILDAATKIAFWVDDGSVTDRPTVVRDQTIRLLIGSLDPLVGEFTGKQALQKILSNLGYYVGLLDGDLSGDNTRTAIRAFQQAESLTPSNGIPDDATCAALVKAQGNVMQHQAPSVAFDTLDQRDDVLDFYKLKNASPKSALVSRLDPYREPTDQTRRAEALVGDANLFPTEVYVAPCDPGDEDTNRNVIQMREQKFVFLDTGKWLGDLRTFGVIWGRHVFLCSFRPTKTLGGAASSSRLDDLFFSAMGSRVDVLSEATANWAPGSDFNWDKLYIVVPDMHMMPAAIGETWRQTYDLQPELDLLEFARDLEIVGLRDCIHVIQIGDSYDLWVGCGRWKSQGNGEGRFEPLFAENATLTVELVGDEVNKVGPKELLKRWIRRIQGLWEAPYMDEQDVGAWIKGTDGAIYGYDCREELVLDNSRWYRARGIAQPDILSSRPQRAKNKVNWVKWVLDQRSDGQGHPELRITKHDFDPSFEVYLNPATAAFQLLERNFEVTYIHGNHDNYLLLPDVYRAAGLAPRHPFYQDKGIFVEHAHRMEAYFAWAPARNHDGDRSGYDATIDTYIALRKGLVTVGTGVFKSGADGVYAQISDQPFYWSEFARVWLGRQSRLEEMGSGSNARRPPHIFVIGHTHEPLLHYISVKDWA